MTCSDSITKAAPTLSDVLFSGPDQSFSNFCIVESNVQALDAVQLFAIGAHKNVALVGPTGWGKSHLLHATAERISSEFGTQITPIDAVQYANSCKIDSPAPLILDNVQEAFEASRTRIQFRILLERRIYAGRPTLLSFTAPRLTRNIRTLMPNYRRWIFAQIQSPPVEERQLILDKMAAAADIHIAPSLIRIIAGRMKGNGRTLTGALQRLNLFDSKYTDTPSILRALGLIDIFFRDNSSWDFREKMLLAACGNGNKVEAKRMVVYLMNEVAGFPESEVAFATQTLPGDVYNICQSMRRELETDTNMRTRYKQYSNRVLELLLND